MTGITSERIAAWRNKAPHDCILAIDDRMGLFAVAWKRAVVSVKGEPETLEQAWAACKYSVDELSDITGLSTKQIKRLVNIAKGLQIVFPDGSLNPMAEKYINGVVVRRIQAIR